MFARRYISGGLAVALLLLSLAPSGTALAAQNQASGTVVASGLASPRGVTVGDDGNLYVAESGSGGDQVVKTGEGEEQTETHLGLTGQVSKIAPDGTKTVVARNLPSAGSPEGEAAGPAGIIYANGALWVTTAGTIGLPARPNDGSVLRIDPQSGAVQAIASLQAYEVANNPGGFAQDSNPYGLALGQDGNLYVADAGGNTLYRLDPNSKQLSVVTVFGGLPLPPQLKGQGPFAQGNPEREGRQEIDPVPTGVTVGPDGSLYVGLLSGFPFLEGGTRVMRVGSDGKASDAATGLTMVTDVKYGPDGMLYASEFGTFSLTSQPPGFTPDSGKIVRINADGSQEVVAGGLNATNGLAFDTGGNLYAVVNSTSPTDGQVLFITNVLAATGSVGMPSTGQGFPLDQALYLSLLLIAGGCALLASSYKFGARGPDLK